jgi:hypothetical protein
MIAPHVGAYELMVDQLSVLRELVFQYPFPTHGAFLIHATGPEMIRSLVDPVERSTNARGPPILAFSVHVAIQVVLRPGKCAPLVVVKAGVIRSLVDRHVHEILAIRGIALCKVTGIARGRADEAFLLRRTFHGRLVELEVLPRAEYTSPTDRVATRLARLSLAREALKADGDAHRFEAYGTLNRIKRDGMGVIHWCVTGKKVKRQVHFFPLYV